MNKIISVAGVIPTLNGRTILSPDGGGGSNPDEEHILTEVEIPVIRVDFQSYYDGVAATGTGCSTDLFATPQYLKIVNGTTGDINTFDIRFSNSDDFLESNFVGYSECHNCGVIDKAKNDLTAGSSVTVQLDEYGSDPRKYMQLKIQCAAWQDSWDKIKVYAIYDTYKPKFLDISEDDTGIYIQDMPMRWFIASQGLNATNKIWCAVPYYPDTTYFIRGGYYANVLSDSMHVFGLFDDEPLNNYTAVLCSMSDRQDRGTYFARTFVLDQKSTEQIDKSAKGGANFDYQWATFTTPSRTYVSGIKWLAFEFAQGDAQPTSSTEESRADKLSDWLSKQMQLQYVSRWEDKNLPRTPTTRLAKQNPYSDDNGTRFLAFMSDHSRNPLVNSKWVLFGDSLTDNYGGHDTTSSYFASKIAQEFCIDFDNRAKSGSNIYAGGYGNYTNVSGIIMLDAYLAELDAGTAVQPDYITVAFGTNSFRDQIGTDADTSEMNTSVYGATKYFIEKIRQKCPGTSIGFVLSPRQNWGAADPQNMRDIIGAREAIRTVCESYGVPYVDMSKESGIEASMLPDGIHISNDETQRLYYHAMRRFMMGL